jgi:hypothetical protein
LNLVIGVNEEAIVFVVKLKNCLIDPIESQTLESFLSQGLEGGVIALVCFPYRLLRFGKDYEIVQC